MEHQAGTGDAGSMLPFDFAVVILLGAITILLFVTLFVVLRASGRILCSKDNKQHATHIYESIPDDDVDDDARKCVTQILKITVCSNDDTSVQQDVLLRVQVEAIPMSGKTITALPTPPITNVGQPPGQKKQLLLHLGEKSKVSNVPDSPKPIVPPKTPRTPRMAVTPNMIKNPALLPGPSRFEFADPVALIHRPASEESSGYLQPTLLRKNNSPLQ